MDDPTMRRKTRFSMIKQKAHLSGQMEVKTTRDWRKFVTLAFSGQSDYYGPQR